MIYIKKFENIEEFEPYFTKKYGVWKGVNFIVVEVTHESKKYISLRTQFIVKDDEIEKYYNKEVELEKNDLPEGRNHIKFQSDNLDECKKMAILLSNQDKYNI